MIQVNINKVVIKNLQGSVATQTAFGGITSIISYGCKFPVVCVCQKNMKIDWLSVDKVIVVKTVCSFLAHRVETPATQHYGVSTVTFS